LDKDKIALLRAALQAFELALLLDYLGASRIGRKYDEHARLPSIMGEWVALGFRCIRRISHGAPNKNQKGKSSLAVRSDRSGPRSWTGAM
jgi:hypothetical protein